MCGKYQMSSAQNVPHSKLEFYVGRATYTTLFLKRFSMYVLSPPRVVFFKD